MTAGGRKEEEGKERNEEKHLVMVKHWDKVSKSVKLLFFYSKQLLRLFY